MKKRIILYSRESTKWQAEEGYNLETQRKRMMSYIDSFYSEDERTIELFEEAGKSAKNLNRPEMERLIQRIKERTVDVICVYCIDRLTRNVRDLADFMDLLNQNKVTLLSVTERIDTASPQGRFFLNMLGSMAQLERENISERVLRALAESAEQGNYPKSRIPFGYKKNESTKKLEIDEEKAKTIQWIFKQIIDENKSVPEITKQLKSDNKFDRTWSDSHIYRIVKNKIYYGTCEIAGKEIKNHTIALVTEEEWNLANKMVVKYDPEKKHEYLYKRKIMCNKCGRIMSCTCGYGTGKVPYLYYKCVSCNMRISEKEVSHLLNGTITYHMRNHIYHYEMKKIKEILKKENIVNSKLSTFTLNFIMYDQNYEYEVSKIKVIEQLPESIFKQLERIKYKLLSIEYEKSSAHNQKRYLDKYIRLIYIDENKMISKIVWKKTKL